MIREMCRFPKIRKVCGVRGVSGALADIGVSIFLDSGCFRLSIVAKAVKFAYIVELWEFAAFAKFAESVQFANLFESEDRRFEFF